MCAPRSIALTAATLLAATALSCGEDKTAICDQLLQQLGLSADAQARQQCTSADLESLQRAHDRQSAPVAAKADGIPAWCWCWLGITNGNGECLLGRGGAVVPLPACLQSSEGSPGQPTTHETYHDPDHWNDKCGARTDKPTCPMGFTCRPREPGGPKDCYPDPVWGDACSDVSECPTPGVGYAVCGAISEIKVENKFKYPSRYGKVCMICSDNLVTGSWCTDDEAYAQQLAASSQSTPAPAPSSPSAPSAPSAPAGPQPCNPGEKTSIPQHLLVGCPVGPWEVMASMSIYSYHSNDQDISMRYGSLSVGAKVWLNANHNICGAWIPVNLETSVGGHSSGWIYTGYLPNLTCVMQP